MVLPSFSGDYRIDIDANLPADSVPLSVRIVALPCCPLRPG